ncbi:MAG: hypothetical protein IJL67_00105 [Oscillospiraceae bacterium]|nr:hypothetical protein [Oscillospiraceae bacterium]
MKSITISIEEYAKMQATIKKLQEEIEQSKHSTEENDTNTEVINSQHKDRLFKFVFGKPDNKPWTLSLYNAINGTDYTDPNELDFNTIEDALYMKMKNDISFIIHFEMNLWEHQSSYNPNMPFRFLEYAGALYSKYGETTEKFNQYSSTLQRIPTPRCICFYNGNEEQPESKLLHLSDAYTGKGDIQVEVTMLNINFGKNKELLDACKPLYEYSWLIDRIRSNQKSINNLKTAVNKTVEEMPDDFIIKPFIIANRAEVKNMLFEEYDEKKYMNLFIEEGREKGREEGRNEGKANTLSILHTISELKDESDTEIVSSIMKQYGISENEAYNFIDQFRMIFNYQH